jgi:hypothetical protein
VKKSDRIARDLELSVIGAMENAKDWAAPHVEAAVDRLQHGLDTASPKIQEGLKTAAYRAADGVAVVTPRIQDGLAQLAPRISDAVDGAPPRLHEALNKATPAILNARDRVVVEYLPRLSDQIGSASNVVHRTLENTPAHVDAVAQKLGDVGIIHAVQGQAQATGTHKKRGWLIFGVIAASVAAGVAAWKASKPVEDPWKTPSPVAGTGTPAPVPATTVNEVPEATTGSASEVAEAAKDTAGDAADKAKHVAEDDSSSSGADKGTVQA